MRQIHRHALCLVAALALTGCLADGGDVSRFLNSDATGAPAPDTPAKAQKPGATTSPIIAALQTRRAVLVPGSAYAQIASSVLAADARVAEAELRAAELRAKAASRNWLPTIGPRVSLTSLGDFVADLLINQVLFDNGRKKAERDLAKAEVELAAVALAEDGNTRVFEALTLYLKAEEGRAIERQFAVAAKDMAQFEWVMNERVKGGVSDMSDLNVLRQKLADLRAKQSAAREATVTALAELAAMSATPVDGISGLGKLGPMPGGIAPLAVLRAEADRDRTVAEAQIARAGHLPGLSATGTVGDSGTNYGLQVDSEQLLGLGTGAALKAIEVSRETATRRVAEAREVEERKLQSQTRQLEALRRQAAEAEALTRQAKANLDLFQRQYDGGQRQVMDVVGVYETYARSLETALSLTYDAARAELEIARIKGVLADGTLL
ncbi:TolC family protein [Thalassococcus sp. BH17M4-6]|uniref:TolC family protein n=1 Tax=Thalassococcus sp. BH17M4-6 TaxID=3413148 RepID=UPI003BE76A92